MAVARLEGEQLEGIAILHRTGETGFCFDLGARLVAPRFGSHEADDDPELWTLHDRSRSRFVAAYAGERYDTGPLSTAGRPAVQIAASRWLVVAPTARRSREILEELRNAAVSRAVATDPRHNA